MSQFDLESRNFLFRCETSVFAILRVLIRVPVWFRWYPVSKAQESGTVICSGGIA